METKLIPRQSPQRPPKPEMKSSQVIFGDLSNSAKQNFMYCFECVTHQTPLSLQKRCSLWQCPFHKHCRTPGPDRKAGKISGLILVRINLDERRYQLPISHRVWILQSQRPQPLIDVAGCLVPVGLQDAWLPHRQRSQVHVAKRTQVQIP